jgi:hypothetical protein
LDWERNRRLAWPIATIEIFSPEAKATPVEGKPATTDSCGRNACNGAGRAVENFSITCIPALSKSGFAKSIGINEWAGEWRRAEVGMTGTTARRWRIADRIQRGQELSGFPEPLFKQEKIRFVSRNLSKSLSLSIK